MMMMTMNFYEVSIFYQNIQLRTHTTADNASLTVEIGLKVYENGDITQQDCIKTIH